MYYAVSWQIRQQGHIEDLQDEGPEKARKDEELNSSLGRCDNIWSSASQPKGDFPETVQHLLRFYNQNST